MRALTDVVILHVVRWVAEPLEDPREASDAGVGTEAAGLVRSRRDLLPQPGARRGAGTAAERGGCCAGAGGSRILVAGPGLRVRIRLYSESTLVRPCFEIRNQTLTPFT